MTGPGEETAFRWYEAPDGGRRPMRLVPQPASWERADHPSQVRLSAFLDAAEQVAQVPPDRAWTLALDVGLPVERSVIEAADLDNYALPLARRLHDRRLVSVWCTKGHSTSSTIATAHAVRASEPADTQRVRVTASAESRAFKLAVRKAVAGREEVPDGPVALQIAFGVGRTRNWLNLWKPTIDALDPLLGRSVPGRDWHPRDGRVVSLGLHVRHREDSGHAVDIAVVASSASC